MAKDKGKFLEVFASKLGNVSKACSAAQISRQTYYDWMKDKEFSGKVGNHREPPGTFPTPRYFSNKKDGKTAEKLYY